MEQRSWKIDNLSVKKEIQLVKKFLTFYGNRKLITVSQEPASGSHFAPDSPINLVIPNFFKNNINIILTSLSSYFKWSVLFTFSEEHFLILLISGSAIAQASKHWLLTVETRVQYWGTSNESSSGQSGTGGGFSPSISVFPC